MVLSLFNSTHTAIQDPDPPREVMDAMRTQLMGLCQDESISDVERYRLLSSMQDMLPSTIRATYGNAVLNRRHFEHHQPCTLLQVSELSSQAVGQSPDVLRLKSAHILVCTIQYISPIIKDVPNTPHLHTAPNSNR